MKRILTALLVVAWVSAGFGQPNPDTLWTRTYGGSHFDRAQCVQQTADGGYIVAGQTRTYGAGSWDLYLVRTNSLGDTLWTRAYGGIYQEYARCVQQTIDGGYIVAGGAESFGAGGDDVWLLKTNSLGDSIWARTFGGSQDDYASYVQQTADSGFIVAGETRSYGAGWVDVYLIKTDSLGNAIWTETYGGSEEDYGCSAQQTTDGGYIVAGFTNSFGAGEYDLYLVKTDSQGDTLWTRTYGGTSYDYSRCVRQTADGGYIVAGHTQSFGVGTPTYANCYLVKADDQGDTLWTHTYGGIRYDYAYSIQQTIDGGYIVAGYTNSVGATYDCYLVKTDSFGDTLWTRSYGGSGTDITLSVQQTTDGGYILGGYTDSFGAGLDDVYLVKTGSELALPPPQGLVAWVDEDSLRLAWQPVPAATSYNVMWSPLPFDGTWSLLTSTSDTTAADIIGTNEKRFYYVTGVN